MPHKYWAHDFNFTSFWVEGPKSLAVGAAGLTALEMAKTRATTPWLQKIVRSRFSWIVAPALVAGTLYLQNKKAQNEGHKAARVLPIVGTFSNAILFGTSEPITASRADMDYLVTSILKAERVFRNLPDFEK